MANGSVRSYKWRSRPFEKYQHHIRVTQNGAKLLAFEVKNEEQAFEKSIRIRCALSNDYKNEEGSRKWKYPLKEDVLLKSIVRSF